jgi:hypothetical protein
MYALQLSQDATLSVSDYADELNSGGTATVAA